MENINSVESLSPFETFISSLNKITKDLKARNEELKKQRKHHHHKN